MVRVRLLLHCCVTLLLLATPALADTVILKNGGVFEGRIIRSDDRVVVLQTEHGTITLKRRQISEIRKKPWSPPKAASDVAKKDPAKKGTSAKAKRKSTNARRTKVTRKRPVRRTPARRSSPTKRGNCPPRRRR